MKGIQLSKKQVKRLRDLRWRPRAGNRDKIKKGKEMRKGREQVRGVIVEQRDVGMLTSADKNSARCQQQSTTIHSKDTVLQREDEAVMKISGLTLYLPNCQETSLLRIGSIFQTQTTQQQLGHIQHLCVRADQHHVWSSPGLNPWSSSV